MEELMSAIHAETSMAVVVLMATIVVAVAFDIRDFVLMWPR